MNTVEICNLALNMLGMPSVVDLDDDSNSSRLCQRFYPVCRDRVLRDHLWSFAAAAVELQALDEYSPIPALPYVCNLPGDLLRVDKVLSGQPYRIFNNKILLQSLPDTLLYVRKVENPEEFDVTFVEALQFALAAELAMVATADLNRVNYCRQEYQQRLAAARSIDSAENLHAFQLPPNKSNWLDSRMGGAGNDGVIGAPIKYVKPELGLQGE